MATLRQDEGGELHNAATSSTSITESHGVQGDSVNRLNVLADGTLQWGTGADPVDVALARTAADTLTLASGDTFRADVLRANDSGSKTACSVAINDADTGLFLQAANVLGLAAGGVEFARSSGTPDAGDTGLLLITNVGGTTTLKIVSIGADDSGGTGYKYLRVPNGP